MLKVNLKAVKTAISGFIFKRIATLTTKVTVLFPVILSAQHHLCPTINMLTVPAGCSNGNLYTFSISVASHSRFTVDIVGTVIQHLYHNSDGYNGFEVSMAVRSSSSPFIAERPMYWNAAGTQGGSDVIGYRMSTW